MGFTYRVYVDLNAINGIFKPGGEIYTRTQEAGRFAESDAEAFANAVRRSGALSGSLGHRTNPGGFARCGFTLYSTVEHARYVNNGTYGPITPKNGPWLKLNDGRNPPNGAAERYFARHPGRVWYRPKGNPPTALWHVSGFVLRKTVSGQRATHFMERAANYGCRVAGLPRLFL